MKALVDANGIPAYGVVKESESVLVSGNQTDMDVGSDEGTIVAVLVLKPIATATCLLEESDGSTKILEMNADTIGRIPIGEYVTSGCKVTTANFAGGELRVQWRPGELK